MSWPRTWGMLTPFLPDVGGHLIAASVMSAPAALAVAKIMLPETEEPVTARALAPQDDRTDVNLLDAAGRGAVEGLFLALKVGAMLIAFLGAARDVERRDRMGRRMVWSLRPLVGSGCSAWCWLRCPGSLGCPGRMRSP